MTKNCIHTLSGQRHKNYVLLSSLDLLGVDMIGKNFEGKNVRLLLLSPSRWAKVIKSMQHNSAKKILNNGDYNSGCNSIVLAIKNLFIQIMVIQLMVKLLMSTGIRSNTPWVTAQCILHINVLGRIVLSHNIVEVQISNQLHTRIKVPLHKEPLMLLTINTEEQTNPKWNEAPVIRTDSDCSTRY